MIKKKNTNMNYFFWSIQLYKRTSIVSYCCNIKFKHLYGLWKGYREFCL